MHGVLLKILHLSFHAYIIDWEQHFVNVYLITGFSKTLDRLL